MNYKQQEEREIELDITLEQAIKDLEEAKKHTRILLDNPEASIDFHGLAYWASKVENLRELIKTLI